jgi:hypothetical protein
MERRRFKQTQSLEERLAEEAKRLRAEAKLLPPGAACDELIRRARQDRLSDERMAAISGPTPSGLACNVARQGAVRHDAPPKRARGTRDADSGVPPPTAANGMGRRRDRNNPGRHGAAGAKAPRDRRVRPPQLAASFFKRQLVCGLLAPLRHAAYPENVRLPGVDRKSPRSGQAFCSRAACDRHLESAQYGNPASRADRVRPPQLSARRHLWPAQCRTR